MSETRLLMSEHLWLAFLFYYIWLHTNPYPSQMKKLFPFFFDMKCICILSLLFFCLAVSAQKSSNPNSSDINNTWYEWPHENFNGNTVYKTVKYEPIPGIDKQDEPFSKLIIKSDGTFTKTQYCGYCPAVKLEESNGKSVINNNNISVSYQGMKQVSTLTIVSIDKDKLVINFQHIINSK